MVMALASSGFGLPFCPPFNSEQISNSSKSGRVSFRLLFVKFGRMPPCSSLLMPHLNNFAAGIRAKLNSRGFPVELLRFADHRKQQRHQFPIMLGDGIGIEAVHGMQPIARPDSPVVFRLLSRSFFDPPPCSLELAVAHLSFFGRRHFLITPGAELLRRSLEIDSVAEFDEIQNIAALDAAVEAKKSAGF